jgi:hypothetical protein
MQKGELQTGLVAKVSDRSSHRDCQRYSRNAWTSSFKPLPREVHPPT